MQKRLMNGDMSRSLEDSLRGAGAPYAILDLRTNRLVAANDAFANLLQIPADLIEGTEVLGLLTPETRAVAECVTGAMASGVLTSCHGTALVRLPGGGGVEVAAWVRSLPGGRALLAAAPAEDQLPEGAPRAPLGHPMTSAPDAFRLVLGALDHEWRFSEISRDATTWFGWNPEQYRGTALQSVVHPDDAPLLLLALGRSGVDRRGVATMVRVRVEPPSSSDGSEDGALGSASEGGAWVPVRCEVSPLCDHNPPRFALAMWVLDTERDTESSGLLRGPSGSPEQRAARLEDHLWRIALEVAAAGIGDAPASGEMWWGDPALRGLSQRQLEILRRLLRGERVPTIAQDLFLSQSTVRNHLSAIYRRVGVHSQAELLARLLPRRRATA